MEIRHFGIVHAIKMVAGEDQNMLGSGGLDIEVGSRTAASAVPWYQSADCSVCSAAQDLDPAGMEGVEDVGLRDVAVKGNGIELSQDGDTKDLGVDAVTDRDVDQAILTGDRHGGLERIFVSG